MNEAYSTRIGDNLQVTAKKGTNGRHIRIEAHQSHVGAEFVLSIDELRQLREFLDVALAMVLPIELPPAPTWEEVQAAKDAELTRRLYEI